MPIVFRGEAIGVLQVANRDRDYTEKDVELLELIGNGIIAPILNARLERDRQEKARNLGEAAVRNREESLSEAQHIAQVGSWEWDLDTGAERWSDEQCRILGYRPGEVAAKHELFLASIHPDDREGVSKAGQDALAGTRLYHAEFRVVGNDGVTRAVEARGNVYRDDHGRPQRMFGTLLDVSERRNLEAQLRQSQKLEGIGQLAGGIAHDFNNILGAVVGFAGILQMSIAEGDPLRHYADEVLAAGERGAELTRQILAFSRKQAVDLKPARLNDVVRGLEKMLRRLLPESIDIVHDLCGEELGIHADTGQLGQVLINLVTNARDATAGSGKIGIATGRAAMDRHFVEMHGYGEPGEYAVLTVSDSGRGMDEATRARIFEPFFTTKELGKGTGLGLAVVHGIVKQHRGFVNVYSEVGKGTVVRIYLPLVAGAGAAGLTAPSEAPVAGGSETILVAEDDAALRKLTRAVLGQQGYTVIDAEDGEEAVAKFAANREAIQLVILDGLMPKLGGVEALERIRRLRPGVKALFMSGYDDNIFSSAGLREREAFIQKPVMPAALLRKVREVLDG